MDRTTRSTVRLPTLFLWFGPTVPWEEPSEVSIVSVEKVLVESGGGSPAVVYAFPRRPGLNRLSPTQEWTQGPARGVSVVPFLLLFLSETKTVDFYRGL